MTTPTVRKHTYRAPSVDRSRAHPSAITIPSGDRKRSSPVQRSRSRRRAILLGAGGACVGPRVAFAHQLPASAPVSGFELPQPKPLQPFSLGRAGYVHRSRPARPLVARVLRLHQLPGRVPDDDAPGSRGARASRLLEGCRAVARAVRVHRSGTRYPCATRGLRLALRPRRDRGDVDRGGRARVRRSVSREIRSVEAARKARVGLSVRSHGERVARRTGCKAVRGVHVAAANARGCRGRAADPCQAPGGGVSVGARRSAVTLLRDEAV